MSKRPAWWLDALRVYWPLNNLVARATSIPLLGRILFTAVRPLFSKKNFNVTYVPVNRSIRGAENMVLPARLIEGLIQKSSHRVVLKRCSCRDSEGCGEFPVEMACLLMGDGARHIDPRIARHVTTGEAVAHLHDRIGRGLIPMLGRVRMDDFYYGVPNEGRLLTICFCCPCCCTVLRSSRFFPKEVQDSLVRVKGLAITVDHDVCGLCGACVEGCFMGALRIEGGGIVRDEGLCKGCGHCAARCPEGAVTMTIDDLEGAMAEIRGRIGERITVE
ncbi:MAG: hypothetical protein E4G96_10375 [Chrysiogenales bacterium]|nr:MAG: hypothetical protein E4G96_10375 [Chrysiogenales bacterium]